MQSPITTARCLGAGPLARRCLVAGLAAGLALAAAGGGPLAARAPAPFLEPGLALAPSNAELSLLVRLEGPSLAVLARGGNAAGRQPLGRSGLVAAQAALRRQQAAPAAAIAATGATVVARYQAIVNGFLVHATPEQIAEIALVTGVVSVARAPVARMPGSGAAHESSAAVADAADLAALEPARVVPTARPANLGVPWIGAPRVWSELGWRGETALVAVLDTGVDYSHAAFGGPGTEQAYLGNNENIVESGTFPTSRVVGGYDLAGPRYSPHAVCGMPGIGGQDCHREPRPDDDPLDTRGNGTHVSSIIAGQAAGTLTEGVAPAARLVALKIFGNPTRAPVVTDLLVGAFDWVVSNNLQLDVPGFATAPIDVVHVGLTDDWLSGSLETERLVKEASDAGLVVVVAFGNHGGQPYLAGPVASATWSLGVAATYAPGEHGLLYEADWTAEGQPRHVEGVAAESLIEGQVPVWPAGFSGDLAWMGSACTDAPEEQPVSGKVALIERGGCEFIEKMANAQTAGATAVIVYTSSDRPVSAMGGTAPIGIPGVMIDHAGGLALRSALTAGARVPVRVYKPDFDVRADVMTSFSNRGPARLSAGVKPQLAAPGWSIPGAWPGAKTSAQSGTSMSAAHVAGTAALLAQRNKARRLGLEAPEMGALLINYAAPTVRTTRSDATTLAPVTLTGAGRVDAWASAVGNTSVHSEDGIAELSFGHVHVLDQPARLSRTLFLHNLATTAKSYAPRLALLKPQEDGDAGVSLAFEPPRITVAAGGKAQVKVTLSVDPAKVRPWLLEGREAVAEPELLDLLQVDGLVLVEEVDAQGAAVPGGDRPAVPLVVLPRRHSCVVSTTPEPFWLSAFGDIEPQRWENRCPEAGTVRLYAHLGDDATDAALPEALDIESVAMRFFNADPADPESDVVMEFAVHTRGSHLLPDDVQMRVYFDLDRDGTYDHVAWNRPTADVDASLPAGRWLVLHGVLPPGELDPALAEPEGTAIYQPYDLDETTARLRVSADDLGIDLRLGTELFDLAVAAVDTRATFPPVGALPASDSLPDDLSGGTALTYDQLALGCVVPLGELVVPGGGSAVLDLTMNCDPPPFDTPLTLAMSQASNMPGALQWSRRDGKQSPQPRPTQRAIFLPYTLR